MKHTYSYYPHKTNKELRSSLFLFGILSKPFFVRFTLLMWKLFRFLHIPLDPFVRLTGYYQFCAGKNVAASDDITSKMAAFNVFSVLDYANEHGTKEAHFDHNLHVIIQTIHKAKEKKHYPFAVVKPTAIGSFDLFEKKSNYKSFNRYEKEAWEAIVNRFELLAYETKTAGIVLMIDAEESWIQPGINAIILPLMRKHNVNRVVIAVTLQLYLKNKLDLYESLLQDAKAQGYYLGVKFVRGAYMEKERERARQLGIVSPVCETKKQTDEQYRQTLSLALHALENHLSIIATHNEKDIKWAIKTCAEQGIDLTHKNLWFSQLYGMRDYISFKLAKENANVVKYVPFGPIMQAIPYLIRRALENSSMKRQTIQERVMLRQELKRRKLSD